MSHVKVSEIIGDFKECKVSHLNEDQSVEDMDIEDVFNILSASAEELHIENSRLQSENQNIRKELNTLVSRIDRYFDNNLCNLQRIETNALSYSQVQGFLSILSSRIDKLESIVQTLEDSIYRVNKFVNLK